MILMKLGGLLLCAIFLGDSALAAGLGDDMGPNHQGVVPGKVLSEDSKQSDYFKNILGPQLCPHFEGKKQSLAHKVKMNLLKQPSKESLSTGLTAEGDPDAFDFKKLGALEASDPIQIREMPVGAGKNLRAVLHLNPRSSRQASYNPGTLKLTYSFTKNSLGDKGYTTDPPTLSIDGHFVDLRLHCAKVMNRIGP